MAKFNRIKRSQVMRKVWRTSRRGDRAKPEVQKGRIQSVKAPNDSREKVVVGSNVDSTVRQRNFEAANNIDGLETRNTKFKRRAKEVGVVAGRALLAGSITAAAAGIAVGGLYAASPSFKKLRNIKNIKDIAKAVVRRRGFGRQVMTVAAVAGAASQHPFTKRHVSDVIQTGARHIAPEVVESIFRKSGLKDATVLLGSDLVAVRNKNGDIVFKQDKKAKKAKKDKTVVKESPIVDKAGKPFKKKVKSKGNTSLYRDDFINFSNI